RARVGSRYCRPARAPAPLRPHPPLRPRPRPQARGRLPGGAAAVHQVHGTLLVDAAARLPRAHPRRDRRRPARRPVPRRRAADGRREDVLRRARRDGDQLDPEHAPLFARSRRRRGGRSVRQRGAGTMTGLPHIRSVAVLGAGTMGAQIAAHLANAGLTPLLLDVTGDVAQDGLKRARALSPDPFFTPDVAARITTGGFDADLARVAAADWIIEAVVERLDVKRELLARVDALRAPGAIVSSNTSGIPIT